MRHLHFRMKSNSNLLMKKFHRKIGASFVEALSEEIYASFDKPIIDPIEALYMLDPVDLPQEILAKYSNEKLKYFYGKPQDLY